MFHGPVQIAGVDDLAVSPNNWWSWAIACIAGTLLATSPAAAQCQYDVTVIQAPDVCGLGSVITSGIGLNDNGAVVGSWRCPVSEHEQAFVWRLETGLISLEMPAGVVNARAFDIDNAGDIVGVMGGVVMPRRGFLRRGNAVVDLGTLPGGNWSEARAVSGGQIVGFWGDNVNGPLPVAFIWRDGIMTDLGPDFGTPNSHANDITRGRITGWMGTSVLSDARAFIWEEGVVVELPPIPGGFTSDGRAINNLRDVAGRGRFVDPGTGDTVWRAFAWIDGEITVLGTLPGFRNSFATGINDARQVVGFSQTTTQEAFIWQNGVMTNLNDLMPPDLQILIQTAWAINQDGQITGSARLQGNTVAVLLTPVARPGDVDIDCAVGLADLEILLDSWGPCPDCVNCLADLDGDCAVAVPDLLRLLANWG